jgi:hypothetical protein
LKLIIEQIKKERKKERKKEELSFFCHVIVSLQTHPHIICLFHLKNTILNHISYAALPTGQVEKVWAVSA